MKRAHPALFVAAVLLSGCTRQMPEVPRRPSAERSTAFRQFSLEAAVARTGVAELRPTLSTGGSGSEPRRAVAIEYAIEGNGAFDEAGFIGRLHAEVERSLEAAGARVGGGERLNDQFSVDYTDGGREGWIEVVGARMPGNRYKLWGVLRESAPSASRG
ncbi:MAG TPA: hypothetical protein VGO40_15420 [Longimicrobium sp.]|jgi:hypothetical protein|nr:hypothetical protein [Longimicrobium sp.]